MPSPSIKSRVEQILGPTTQVHAVAAVKLYVAESQAHWEWTRVSGAVALATTNEPGRYLYVVDLKNNSIPLTQEIYENFGYDAPRDFFHSFEMDDCVAGLSFADTADAKAFYQAVTAKSAAPRPQPQPPMARPSPPPVQQPPPPVAQPPNVYSNSAPATQPTAGPPSPQLGQKSAANQPPAPSGGSAGKKKAGGIFSKLKSAFASSDAPEDFVVSDPRGFRHESHIGWDPEAGFEIRNIPPEWRKLFQAAGVRKNDLRDAETAKFVMNVIGETMLSSMEQEGHQQEASTPAPPAPTGGPAPPPPPPPPAHKAPGAPPPPAPGKTAAARPPPPVRDARGDLMNSIKQGTELRKVDPNEPRPGGLPDINSMNPTDSKNLVDTLAAAMAARRNAIQSPDVEEEEEEEWSD